jgi:hypothetical protein
MIANAGTGSKTILSIQLDHLMILEQDPITIYANSVPFSPRAENQDKVLQPRR